MRRALPVLLTCLFFTIPVFAQRGGHGGSGGGMRGGSFGGMRGGSFGGARGAGFSGGVHSGGGFGGFRGGFNHGGGFGGFRGGFNHQRFFGSQFGFGRFRGSFIYPFYGGFGYYDPFFNDSYANPYPYASYPSAGYSNTSAPPVIISQNYYSPPAAEPAPTPRVEEYRPEPVPQAERKDEPSLYLIAFKDHIIRAVLAYWADGPTLHYVTMDHEQKQTTVASVDRDLSERLNRERNVTFRLPR